MTPERLKIEGYKLENLGKDEILGFRRCRNCHARIRTRKSVKKDEKEKAEDGDGDGEGGGSEGNEKRNRRRGKGRKESGEKDKCENATQEIDGSTVTDAKTDDAENDEDNEDKEDGGVRVTVTVREMTDETGKGEKSEAAGDKQGKEKGGKKKKTAVCQFHTGRVMDKHFTCCQEHVSTPGCVEMDQHTPVEYAKGELEMEWILYATPTKPMKWWNPRMAVALDCEMGVSIYGEPELVRISLVDFFTGEILIDSLVYPRVRLQHLNTRYSGVTRGMLETARKRKQCIMGGRDAARALVWRYVGRETIVVMHGGQSDMMALRWIHDRVIDTFVVEGWRRAAAAAAEAKKSEAELEKKEGTPGGRSLKHLTETILGAQIQQGRGGHDSVEDAMACRWLADWYVRTGLG